MDHVIDFTLTGRDGMAHRYKLTLHGGEEGFAVAAQLMALGAEPLGRLMQAATQSGKLTEQIGAALGEDGLDQDALKVGLDILRDIDLAGVGADVRSALLGLDAGKFVRELLKHAIRDGRDLSDDAAFSMAYRGNYGELMGAAWKSIEANGFFALPATS